MYFSCCPSNTRSIQNVFSHVLWKIETLIEEDPRYKKHSTQDNDTSVPFKVGTSEPPTALLIAISHPIIFSWVSSMIWNLFPFKRELSFGKSQKLQGTKSGLKGAESPGWFDVSPKKLCTRHDAWVGTWLWWSCQSLVAHTAAAFWIIQIVSTEECSSFVQNLMLIFAVLAQSFWMWQPHSTHAHSMASTAPTD